VGGAGLAIDLRYELECHPLDEAGKRKREPRLADDWDRQRNGDEEKADETPLHRAARVAPSEVFGRKVCAHGYSLAIQMACASPDRGLSHAEKGECSACGQGLLEARS
jgi:hypothetical protein